MRARKEGNEPGNDLHDFPNLVPEVATSLWRLMTLL